MRYGDRRKEVGVEKLLTGGMVRPARPTWAPAAASALCAVADDELDMIGCWSVGWMIYPWLLERQYK